ncbi:MAG: hypothetical protein AB7O52_11890 [Planctomycetota bacterium]
MTFLLPGFAHMVHEHWEQRAHADGPSGLEPFDSTRHRSFAARPCGRLRTIPDPVRAPKTIPASGAADSVSAQ